MRSKREPDTSREGVVQVIGLEAYLKLVEAFGSSVIYIPSAKAAAFVLENWLVKKEAEPYAG